MNPAIEENRTVRNSGSFMMKALALALPVVVFVLLVVIIAGSYQTTYSGSDDFAFDFQSVSSAKLIPDQATSLGLGF